MIYLPIRAMTGKKKREINALITNKGATFRTKKGAFRNKNGPFLFGPKSPVHVKEIPFRTEKVPFLPKRFLLVAAAGHRMTPRYPNGYLENGWPARTIKKCQQTNSQPTGSQQKSATTKKHVN